MVIEYITFVDAFLFIQEVLLVIIVTKDAIHVYGN